MTVQLPKAKVGQHWHRLFRGDPDGARCLQPPYQLSGAVRLACVDRGMLLCWGMLSC